MPAVFVHGVPDTPRVWRALLARVARKDVVTLSLPGFGCPVPEGFDATKEAYVDWLLGELTRQSGPIDIVGHDWGALLVVRVVSLRPEAVRSWAVGGAPLDPDYEWHQAARAFQTPGMGEREMESMTAEGLQQALVAAAAEGVWYVTGGSHHSVVIEMADHTVVVESPLNDERATAVIAAARRLVPGKPIRYVINSHHHFDHAGELRAFAAEGITVITHETTRAFFEGALAAPATMTPDRQQAVRRKVAVEGVRDKRVLTDGARRVEIHHMAGSTHADGMLMIYLPKERLLIQADAFTPGPPNAPVPAIINPLSVNLADNITRLNLGVDRLLPLHGRIVPLAELHRMIGRSN